MPALVKGASRRTDSTKYVQHARELLISQLRTKILNSRPEYYSNTGGVRIIKPHLYSHLCQHVIN